MKRLLLARPPAGRRGKGNKMNSDEIKSLVKKSENAAVEFKRAGLRGLW